MGPYRWNLRIVNCPVTTKKVARKFRKINVLLVWAAHSGLLRYCWVHMSLALVSSRVVFSNVTSEIPGGQLHCGWGNEARSMCRCLQRVSCRRFISHRTPSPDHWRHSRWERMNRVGFIFSLFTWVVDVLVRPAQVAILRWRRQKSLLFILFHCRPIKTFWRI